jgi:hypothetical protein
VELDGGVRLVVGAADDGMVVSEDEESVIVRADGAASNARTEVLHLEIERADG